MLSVLALSTAMLSCGNGEIVLFDYRTTPADSVRTLFGSTVVFTGTGLAVHSPVSAGVPGVAIPVNRSLTDCNRLRFTIRNTDSMEYLPVTIRLSRPDAKLPESDGVFLERVYVPAGTTQTYTISLPSPLPHPEVQEKFSGMRRSPYYQWGSMSRMSLDEVADVSVYIRRPREEWNWELVEISALKGRPDRPYSWMTMNEEEFFPFIDRYGQFSHNDWPGKTHSDEELQQAFIEESQDLDAWPGPEGRSRFGGWADGPKLAATGHFRIEKVAGKWWLVDPEGYLYWSHGVVRVTPSSGVTPLDGREFYFEELPQEGTESAEFYHTNDELLRPYYTARGIRRTYDFSAANIKRKYGGNWRAGHAERAHRRLRSWGLNTIANSSDRKVTAMSLTPYIDRIEIKSPELESSYGVWWKFKDPFHPEFRTAIRRQLLERKDELDDPWCIGYFVDNEIDWGEAETLGAWTLQCPASQPAKIEMIAGLKQKYGGIENLNRMWGTAFADWNSLLESDAKPVGGALEDCVDFSVEMTEAYFRIVREEFKKVAPQKLYMGCRFARSNPNVIAIGAKYCDVISYNIYKRNLYGFALPDGVDKPVMIGEFHFGATDRGLFHPGLVKTSSQQQRAEAYADYVESSLRHPAIIGTHWHQFSDQAATGRFDGENFQVGFVDICDRPYPETIAKIREIGYRMYEIRNGNLKR